ncbi:MAG: arginine--tRNA ligase [Candidatus Kerfeldbacteria bacterium]|nr:arginine--tRNA ligase [Candidatus Kerfeldbacteria bacterium]
MLSLKLQKELAQAAAKHYSLKPHEVEVTLARDLGHGDFTSNVALRVASRWGVTPREAADTLIEELKDSSVLKHLVTKIEMAGPGFINFWLAPEVIYKNIKDSLDWKDWQIWKGEKMIVEYSSPNIAKPMHIGHIRSTIIGQALSNIYEALGAKVIRLNHLGDWGTQFGKLIAAYKMWGNKAAVKKQPIAEMLKLYVKFHEVLKEQPDLEKMGQEEFLKLEQGDRKNRSLWNWFKTESLREFNVLYRRLKVKFSQVIGESFYEPLLEGVVFDLLRRKLAFKNEDNSIVVYLEAASLPPCLIKKSDGGSLYATRDLAAIQYRAKHFKPVAILYVVGNEQSLHFEQVFSIATAAGYSKGIKLEHIKYGLILGEDGQKLATREGKTIPLEEVLDKANNLALEIVNKKNANLTAKQKMRVAEVVGVGAVKYNDLSQNRLTDITFNWERMLSVEGNSGPYLQYTYARLRSILRKSKIESKFSRAKVKTTAADLHNISTEDMLLWRMIMRYPESLLRAAQENGPHLLALYLYELAVQINSFYQNQPVLRAAPEVKVWRLRLVDEAAQILKQGLEILGIETLEEM